jgi:hypothetical protein
MAKITHQNANALLALRAKLDPKHPGFRATPEIAKALEQCRCYLDGNVFPLIDFLEGRGWHGQRSYIEQDAARARGAIAAAAVAKAKVGA